jgi:hypothetical protein
VKTRKTGSKVKYSAHLEEKNEEISPEFPKASPRLKALYERAMVIVSREIARLRDKSLGGKLRRGDAADLARYIKAMGEIMERQEQIAEKKKKRQAEELDQMSEEEFQKKLREYLSTKEPNNAKGYST